MIGVAVAGFGYWGPNLVRNFRNNKGFKVIGIIEPDVNNHEAAQRLYPNIELYNEFDLNRAKILTQRSPSSQVALAIATPVNTHFKLAKDALENGFHVLIEKPMAETVEECTELIEIAQKNEKVLMVDHTFVYTPAVREIRRLIQNNELGDLLYYDSIRANLGIFREVNVLYDLAIHDISILGALTPAIPLSVSATGVRHIEKAPTNIAFMTLYYPNNFVAHVNVNWMSPLKLRQIIIAGTKKMVVYNDIEPDEKVKIYDKGADIDLEDNGLSTVSKTIMNINYRVGDVYSPFLDRHEALSLMVADLRHAIENKNQPISSGRAGRNAVAILNCANISISRGGSAIAITNY